jgi:hypothetical protein
MFEITQGGYEIEADSTLRNVPKSPNQWFRFIVPLYLHAGLIHLVIILFIQLYAGCQIETEVSLDE